MSHPRGQGTKWRCETQPSPQPGYKVVTWDSTIPTARVRSDDMGLNHLHGQGTKWPCGTKRGGDRSWLDVWTELEGSKWAESSPFFLSLQIADVSIFHQNYMRCLLVATPSATRPQTDTY